MFKPVLWRMLVEKTNWYLKRCKNSKWKEFPTAEMKGFLSATLNIGLIKRNMLNDYWVWKNVQLYVHFTLWIMTNYLQRQLHPTD